MRALDFINIKQLFEIKMMAPGNLEKLASRVNANVGIEFEMVLPGMLDTSESEPEPDYDQDETISDIEDIVQFFYDGDHNNRLIMRSFERDLRENYNEWHLEQAAKEWEKDKKNIIENYIQDEEFDSEEEREERIDELLNGRSRESQRLQEKFIDEYTEEDRESDFLADHGLRYMSNVEDRYGLSWPHWTTPDNETEFLDVVDTIIVWLQPFVKPYGVTSGSQNYSSEYSVEEDTSIDTEGDDTAVKLEIVSPYMPLYKMSEEFRKINEFCLKYNASTNDTTGLHINVSIPNRKREDLDFMKLALLLGDKWVLESYDRLNTRWGQKYTASVLGKIEEYAETEEIDSALDALSNLSRGFSSVFSKLFTENLILDKYVSVNVRNSDFLFVEFRSVGGNWLDIDIQQIQNTINRFVVMLDAASDPEKFKQEYLGKLYRLLSKVSPENKTAIDYFAAYKSDPDLLKSMLRHRALGREAPKGIMIRKWTVSADGAEPVEVEANSRTEAIRKAIAQNPDFRNRLNTINAQSQNIQAYASDPNLPLDIDSLIRPTQRYEWEVRSKSMPWWPPMSIVATSKAQAISDFLEHYPLHSQKNIGGITAVPVKKL